MYQKPMLKEGSLEDQVIVVTGGGSGLGKAMSTYFLELGASVVITSRNIEKLEKVKIELEEKTGGKVLAVQCDVRNYAEVEDVLAATLKEFAENPKSRYKEGGKIGFTAILHTWDQKLLDHFHLHCVIPAGYLSNDGEQWIHSKKNFLFPVKALSKVFRGKFMELMEEAFQHNDLIF